MSDIAIKIENLSKQYRLGNIGTGTLRRDLQGWLARARGREDPNLKIGMENTLSEKGGEYVYALKDINLEVKQGEILGLIGKNGAGKSTLLKILSRVTTPTSGTVDMYGRVASLLEVGTGFHPELTGRENIFLNGAIMGMSKQEIKNKFEEIVDFSGVGKYIDTPVKRYSSGMYVRLAFGVAAYLEPEILIVDEVLAVGDAEFQRKAIGKMQDVSRNHGRTVILVSHNMTAIENLCSKICVMKQGAVAYHGSVNEGIRLYLKESKSVLEQLKSDLIDDEDFLLKKFDISQGTETTSFKANEPIVVSVNYQVKKNITGLRVGFDLTDNATGIVIFRTFHDENNDDVIMCKTGNYISKAEVPPSLLKEGSYSLSLSIGIHNVRWISNETIIKSFDVYNIGGVNRNYAVVNIGVITPFIKWETYN